MIIKKKYTTQKTDKKEKITELIPDLSEVIEPLKQEEIAIPEPEESVENESPKKNEDIFNLDIENIQFEQREERREGVRRRGYRRTQDRNIINRAQQDAISIKEAAKKDGYIEGVETAKQDLQTLKDNFAEFFNYKNEVYDKVSECIMEVATKIASKILNKEVETDREYIIPVIKGVLEEINKTENRITLKVMPKDVEILRENVNDIFSGNYFEAKVVVVPDNEIKNGGVKVETSNGIIDATIETQLAIIEKALKKQKEE